RRFSEFVIRHQRRLLIGFPMIILAFAAGISQIKLEDDFLRYFDERYEMRQATDYFENNLGGLNVLEYALETDVDSGINSVDYLKKVEAFTEFLRDQPEISNVRSVSDIVKQLNKSMNADREEFYRLPDSDEEVSQYLFLYELSLGYGMDLTDQINIDRSAIRVTAYIPNTTTAAMIALDGRIQDWFAANAPELATPVTGQTHVYTMISARDVPAMLQGTLLALVFISLIILFVLRDVKLGIISLVPNLVPAAMAFGLWGFGVGTVTLAVSVVVAMTLGIVVDDTVHFMLKYAEAKKRGETAENAVRYAFKSVGMALTVTTIGLVLGFFILGMSGFAVNRDLARLTAVTLSFALIVDFLFLPPLLIWIDKMKTFRPSSAATAAIALLALAVPATLAISPAFASAEKGLAIATEQSDRDNGWGDFEVVGQMVLKNKAGKESVREFKTMTLEESDPSVGDKSVIVFTKPRDVRGTALLTHSNIEPNDDNQWLFLPALKRVKRISSSNRTGKFVSSEFSYEDLGAEEINDNSYMWIEDLPCPGDEALMCAKVEITPKNKKSGYSKRVAYIDMEEYRTYKIEFYNRRGDLEKNLVFADYRQYLGQFWRAHVMDMQNVQTGKSTTLQWDEYTFNAGISPKTFEPKALPKVAR
ncbi:MAG: outer membrane lipoprotein-sorting protein, partial [Alphaproteobacteria bacterium]|nr:outer membrane lipoprotein-sorting protein [Alphaproteobacteria bacterium]